MKKNTLFFKKLMALTLCAAMFAGSAVAVNLQDMYVASEVSYQTMLDTVYTSAPYFDKAVFAEGTAYAPVIEAVYASGMTLKDFLFATYINNSTYYPTPESFFYADKPTITLNAATGVVMYQDDYNNCIRYHNGEMAAEVAFYQTMLNSGIFTEVLRKMTSNTYFSGIGLDWTQAVNIRYAYMGALGYSMDDMFVAVPNATIKETSWYADKTVTKVKDIDKILKNKKSNVMFTGVAGGMSEAEGNLMANNNTKVYSTRIQPIITDTTDYKMVVTPDWTFSYPEIVLYSQTETHYYTMADVYSWIR